MTDNTELKPTNVVDKRLNSMYRGKKLDEYTKDELIDIVIEIGTQLQQESYEHSRKLDMLGEILRSRK